ncbi:MAG: ATP-binding cassette domain-containing protein [Streptosporangiales bacterium]|nr:ATP-binding cassette domain-containing protein [Streptosporangiales bacterium]
MSHALPVSWSGFTYTYPGEDTPALDGITLEVAAGEKILVMGSSGCGKSTLGLTLNGIVPESIGGASAGSVTVGPYEPAAEPLATMAASVGLVFQDPDSQLCTINVRDEITFGPQNLLVPAEEIRARTERVARLAGIAGRLDDNVFDLSGGQKQRLAIASALALEPRVLALDEPTANLDPSGRQEVLNVLREIVAGRDATTLIVEHHPAELLTVTDRVVVMEDGRVVHVGPPRELFATAGHDLRRRGVRLPAAVGYRLGLDAAGTVPLRDTVELTPAELDHDALLGPAVQETPPPTPKPAPAPRPVLEVEDVTFGYGDIAPVLRGLNLTVGEGEIVALLGANGSGKSTTGSLLVGLHKPDAGAIRVTGRDTVKVPVAELAKHVGYVFQYPEHQFVTDQVLEEVAFSLRRLGRGKGGAAAVRRLAEEQLERFDLAHLAGKHPFKLSLGQKRRLSIAAMSVYRPDVLVLDEPTFGQDQLHTDQLAGIVRELRDDGVAVLMITHDLRLAAELADRAVVLAGGTVAFDDAPATLLENLHAEPRWGLWPLEEYALWREVARRQPAVGFTADSYELGRRVAAARKAV